MAFATLVEKGGNNSGAQVTTHPLDFPVSAIAAGDYLVYIFTVRLNPTITGWPAGWTAGWALNSTTNIRQECRYKLLTGSETAFSLTSNAAAGSSHEFFLVRNSQSAPEFATSSAGSADPDPPSLTPSWGAADTLWIASGGSYSTMDLTAYPTNYINTQLHQWRATNGTSTFSATRALNAATEDPGIFDKNTNLAWIAGTIAFRSPASGPTYTLTADAGSVAISGTAAAVLYNRKLIAAAGVYLLTGTAATLSKVFKLTAAAGTVTLSGTAATLRVSRKLSAAPASFVITGTAATLRKVFALTAAAGTVTISGTAASFRLTRKLTASAGSVAITGIAANVVRARKLVAASGAVAITGTAATFRYNRAFKLQAGSFIITGTDAQLSVGGRIANAYFFTDQSGPRFTFQDESGARYRFNDASDARQRFTDRSQTLS